MQAIYKNYLKRVLDIICALLGIIVLSPVLIIVAFLVRTKIGSPVIFQQKRPGMNGKIFTLKKFRTMTDQKDADGNLLPDDKRLTSFGKALRATSLDELPELWNILVGEMSVVGPRPLLVQYLPLYNERQMRRHEVRPGLTGFAQVNGRNTVDWPERLEMDVQYIENISLLLDIKIIFMTIYKVFAKEGINAENSATMEAFKGNDKEQKE